jgi:2,3-bisphosphoglycerate-dependent phosphoglycerate mutase
MASTLVTIRHGQSTWNEKNLFTGWADVDLTELGREEARNAGRVMAAEGLQFDTGHTSLQLRAVRTANLALEEMGQLWLPVNRHWRLNERHYGSLQGKDKKQTADEFGIEQVHVWRRSYDVPPPPVDASSEHHPSHDQRYHLLAPEVLPASECLKDVVARVLPYWYDVIVPQLRAGLAVVVVAHGNSLRALRMHLEGIAEDEIAELNIPTGVPRMYRFAEDLSFSEEPRYLGDQAAIAAAAEAVAKQAG